MHTHLYKIHQHKNINTKLHTIKGRQKYIGTRTIAYTHTYKYIQIYTKRGTHWYTHENT